MTDYLAHPHAGFVMGVELGRWGIPHVGAWHADDVYDMKRLESAMPARSELLNDAGRAIGRTPDRVVEEIDAGGLYACLARLQHYTDHEFRPYEDCAFGPDLEWGISLRQQGHRNYIDWSVAVEHCRPDGTSVHPRATSAVSIRFTRGRSGWDGRYDGR